MFSLISLAYKEDIFSSIILFYLILKPFCFRIYDFNSENLSVIELKGLLVSFNLKQYLISFFHDPPVISKICHFFPITPAWHGTTPHQNLQIP